MIHYAIFWKARNTDTRQQATSNSLIFVVDLNCCFISSKPQTGRDRGGGGEGRETWFRVKRTFMLPAGWHIPVYVWLNIPREPAYIINEKLGEGEIIIFPYKIVFIPNNYKICALNMSSLVLFRCKWYAPSGKWQVASAWRFNKLRKWSWSRSK